MPRYPTAEADVRQTQRWYFLLQSFIIVFWHIGCGSFAILALTQPVFTKQALPFHAWLPMDLHNPEKHPIAHALVYAWQVMSLSYNLCICVYVDLQSTFCYPEVAVNLKILCIELNAFARECQHDEQRFRREFRRLAAFHQRMMRNVTSINDVYYWPMIGQMVFVFVMISLTAFIALANKGDPNTYKFIVFMILSLAYLTFICALGDMVTQQSQEVAMAAYDIYEHAPNSKEVQLDIGFMMYRAQEPLQIGAPPFPPFNLISNMAVLKQCYAILTVLLETLD
ncbi:putative odorant receptor 65c [Drosophila busckii]|uniref:putative odorant receptor 65c n=1 Tax=Drosophila busckii TaxID=30019 RepID=UPI00083F205B|nr:putative odorant receptor 65c [Drosophila busckii]